jgi:hypothetical protein
MYLPLVREVLFISRDLSEMGYESAERKEWLVIFLYLLQGCPNEVLRSFVRSLSVPDSVTKEEVAFKRAPPAPSGATKGAVQYVKTPQNKKSSKHTLYHAKKSTNLMNAFTPSTSDAQVGGNIIKLGFVNVGVLVSYM